MPDVKDRQHLLMLHKKAKKIGLDINQYNNLKDQVSIVDCSWLHFKIPDYKHKFLEQHVCSWLKFKVLQDNTSDYTSISQITNTNIYNSTCVCSWLRFKIIQYLQYNTSDYTKKSYITIKNVYHTLKLITLENLTLQTEYYTTSTNYDYVRRVFMTNL